MQKAVLLVLLAATCTWALPSSTGSTKALPRTASVIHRVKTHGLSLPQKAMHLRGGGFPPTEVIVNTCIGGAIGAFARMYLQNHVPAIVAKGPWRNILVVNLFGALLLGIVTSARFPKNLAAILIPACRILSAVVTLDAYGLYTTGSEAEAMTYLASVVPFNLVMNYIGRRYIAPALNL